MGRDTLIQELTKWINSVKPQVSLGDNNSIYLTEWQEGYISALKEVRGKLLGYDENRVCTRGCTGPNVPCSPSCDPTNKSLK